MMAPNPGYSAGINNPKKHSKVARLAWAWKGARNNLKERQLSAMQAITEGRELAESSSNKVSKAGGRPQDVAVALVFAKRENLGKKAGVIVFQTPDPHADSNDLTAARDYFKHVPVGLVVCVLDRKKGDLIAHARPFILQDPPLRLLEDVVANVADLKDWRVS
jgi:hypothetical protein